MIRGKKNFLHPNRMEMGFTFLYKLDNESLQRKFERKKELQGEVQEEAPVEIKREQSNFQQEEEYSIIDLQAEARKAK